MLQIHEFCFFYSFAAIRVVPPLRLYGPVCRFVYDAYLLCRPQADSRLSSPQDHKKSIFYSLYLLQNLHNESSLGLKYWHQRHNHYILTLQLRLFHHNTNIYFQHFLHQPIYALSCRKYCICIHSNYALHPEPCRK